MLIGAAGFLTGYDGSFEFKQPGQPYDDTVYLGMRMVNCPLRISHKLDDIVHATSFHSILSIYLSLSLSVCLSVYLSFFLSLTHSHKFCALTGAASVLLVFLTTWDLSSPSAAILAAVMVMWGEWEAIPSFSPSLSLPLSLPLPPFPSLFHPLSLFFFLPALSILLIL